MWWFDIFLVKPVKRVVANQSVWLYNIAQIVRKNEDVIKFLLCIQKNCGTKK